jgi:hypothetical protein
MRARLVIAAVVIALVGCGEPSSPPTTTAIRLQGTVLNAATQTPIDQAEIILQWSAGAYGVGTHWAYTDAQGRYTLDRDFGGAPFTCDGFAMTAQATGYRPEFVQPGHVRCVSEAQTFDFALQPEP